MFVEIIHNELKKRDWTIKKLSLEAGIRYPSLTEFLKGSKDLTGNNLEKILKVLEIDFNTKE